MPLPDERPRQSVANLIGRFEQQTKKQPPSSPGPRSSSVVSHTTGDSAKEEIKEKKEWPPRTSTNATSPPHDSKPGGREWPPRLSVQGTGDSPAQRWTPIQPTIQASPFSELKKGPTSPLVRDLELSTPPEVTKPPSPPAETPKVIEIVPPSRKPSLVEPEPELPKPIEPEPADTPKTPPHPTVAPPSTKSGSSSVVAKSPPKSVKSKPTKSNTKTPSKPPPSSFTKGSSLQPDSTDRRTSTSARPPSRPTSRTSLRSKTPPSRTSLRSKTPTSTPVRPPSSSQRKPPTETPKHTSTPVKRSKTPTTTHPPPTTPSKPSPVIPRTPNSRLYAPTAASLAKSTNSPQPPPPERKKTLSSGASLERLSKPTASSLSKSKNALPPTSPPKSKPTQTRTGTLATTKKTTTTSKPGSKTKGAGSTPVKKDDKVHAEHHENGNGVGEGLLATRQVLHPESVPSDAESHEPESDHEHEQLRNGSLEPGEPGDEVSLYDHEVVNQGHVEEPELVGSHSPEPVDPDHHAEGAATPEVSYEDSTHVAGDEGQAKDEIADIVGLLESTSFTSKHILQGSDEGVVNDLGAPVSDKERVGEIPDEE